MAESSQSSSNQPLHQTGGIVQPGPGSNVLISNGHFVQSNQLSIVHNCYDADDGFKHLQAHLAPAAWAGQDGVDAPKCHPNTRKAVLDDIMNWVILEVTRIQWILWLNGAAGAGKSAIARSIVELCLNRQIVIARFFFFRTDSTRNHLGPLVATLAYQLIQQIHELEAIIIPKIRSHPQIFNESLETQFRLLIVEPLRQLYLESPFHQLILLLFDGVDESNGHDTQANFIRVVIQFIEAKAVPIIALFSSWPEYQIKAEFQSSRVSRITRQLALDNHYIPDNDIHLFLNDSFARIKETHQLNHFLEPDWPAPVLVQEIVDKSSGQFIYASVVIKFISSPCLHPAQQLEIVRGIRPSGNLTPFAQLDALYRHIFSQIQDLDCVTLILAYFIYSPKVDISYCSESLDILESDIYIALADLTSVISYDNDEFHFLHASLPDFLLDQTRSKHYYIDKAIWSTKLSILFLSYLMEKKSKSTDNSVFPIEGISDFLDGAECTPGSALQQIIMQFNPEGCVFISMVLVRYLDSVLKLAIGDGGEAYRQQLPLITHVMQKKYPYRLDELRQNHSISDILAQIEKAGKVKSFTRWFKSKILQLFNK